MTGNAASVIATAALILLAAACGGGGGSSTGSGSSSNAGGSPSFRSLVGFSRCMRSHGVPRFPDPDSSGMFPASSKGGPQQLGAGFSQFTAARRACQHLLPNTISGASVERCETAGVCSHAVTLRELNDGLSFAQCMRSHGVRNWPDPAAEPLGRVAFPISISKDGFDPESSQINHTMNECGQLMSWGGAPLAVSP